ncbi:MAG: HEAT repeat domain-containing protein [Pirellulales bacterium]
MPSFPRRNPIRQIVAGLGLLIVVGGCAGGPFGLAKYNPVLVDEWKKDEKYGQTLPQRLEEMDRWEAEAAGMPKDRQLAVSQQLDGVIRQETNTILVTRAVKAQAAFPTEVALESLRFALSHPQSDVRIAACKGWGKRGGPDAPELLANVLGSDTDQDVRLAAAKELEHFRSPVAIQALGLALEDGNPALQYRCVTSLKEVTGKDYGEDVRAWREYVASGQAKPAPEASVAERFLKMLY